MIPTNLGRISAWILVVGVSHLRLDCVKVGGFSSVKLVFMKKKQQSKLQENENIIVIGSKTLRCNEKMKVTTIVTVLLLQYSMHIPIMTLLITIITTTS